ncbi:MAG: PSD1 and planctomycete cytochrome C domain-containing protein [Bryobacteraceae bacterium]
MKRKWCGAFSRSAARLSLAALLLFGRALGAPGDPVEFFEKRVQPILTRQCLSCHGATKMGGLQLDSRESVLKGGQSGPAVVPGSPEASLLIRAVSHTHERLKMPPQGMLSLDEIAALRSWVESGAHWTPSTSSAQRSASGRAHWAFQKVRKPAIPAVREPLWAKSPIDNFILAKLEAAGLKPVKTADKQTWIRRATFDLIGLPPTPAEVDHFVADNTPGAYAAVVNRLLASPHYGERWGRHWLDVARYADDDPLGLSADPFPNAFRYRDWVVQAFNDDMPYDLFIKAQIAGDLLDEPGAVKLRPGVGLFGLGPWYYKIVEPPKARADERHDRVDVLTRGFLGLTVACARCHDHKYDPISIRDYYALAGVFANTELEEFPLAAKEVVDDWNRQQKQIEEQEAAIKKLLEREREQLQEKLAAKIADYLVASRGEPAGTLDTEILERWKRYLAEKELAHPYLTEFQSAPDPGRIRQAAEEFQRLVLSVVEERKSIEEYNRLVLEEAKKSTDPYDIFCKGCNAVTKALPRDRYVLWTDLFGRKQRTVEKEPGVLFWADDELDRFLAESIKDRVEVMRQEAAALKKSLPARYPFLHSIRDIENPIDLKLHLRGDPYNLGEPVPRRFLPVLSGSRPEPFKRGSGRLDLANAIAHPDNPLTARVIVNRVWQHHFGAGLVRTPSNFGIVGDRPSHPELLDYLATLLVENNWSIKRLHREIMLSATYALGSGFFAANFGKDPENRLVWRATSRRLDAEALRDALLFVAGNLDTTVGGPAVDWTAGNHRRTIYGKVSRYRLERMLSLFDFPDPTITCEQRATTNVPLQRLFFLNSELMEEQARALAERVRAEAGDDVSTTIRHGYRLLFGRLPSDSEMRAGKEFLEADNSSQTAWQEYARVLLSSNGFIFLD